VPASVLGESVALRFTAVALLEPRAFGGIAASGRANRFRGPEWLQMRRSSRLRPRCKKRSGGTLAVAKAAGDRNRGRRRSSVGRTPIAGLWNARVTVIAVTIRRDLAACVPISLHTSSFRTATLSCRGRKTSFGGNMGGKCA